MFIIYGTKVRQRRLGRRPDFCRICRKIRPFRVEQIESVSHLYYIPLGSGKIHGHIKSCEDCGVAFDADVDDAMQCSRVRGSDLAELIASTNPQVAKECSERLELEQKVKSRKLTAAERESLILEPFVLLNPALQHRASQVYFDRVSTLALLATIVLPLGVLGAGKAVSHVSDDSLSTIALALAGFLALFTIGALVTDKSRFCRRTILPNLARALFPLDPSFDEIDQALAKLKTMGWAVGKRIKTGDVMTALQCHLPAE
jgi:hypothetical protein